MTLRPLYPKAMVLSATSFCLLALVLLHTLDQRPAAAATHAIERLWPETVSLYLQSPLWEPDYNYDASNMLMLPMYYAFKWDRRHHYADEFDHFFRRYLDQARIPIDTNPLREAQFLYLISQYLVLSHETKRNYTWHSQLQTHLRQALEHLWLYRSAPHWAYSSDFPSARKRLLWKQKPSRTQHRYFSAIIDEEYFMFAIAADLMYLDKDTNKSDALLNELTTLAFTVFKQGGIFDEAKGTWRMQPGVWYDHPDYRYAGHLVLEPELTPKPVAEISMDSSHSHRMPLWLKSLSKGATNSQQADFYLRCLQGFNQLFSNTTYFAPGEVFAWPALSNYLDGHNGIYRYRYQTTGKQLGYGPYQLSYALIHGWYGLMPSIQLQLGYIWQAKAFPMPEALINFYIGPDTTRKRHSMAINHNFYRNGYAELLVNIALIAQLQAL